MLIRLNMFLSLLFLIISQTVFSQANPWSFDINAGFSLHNFSNDRLIIANKYAIGTGLNAGLKVNYDLDSSRIFNLYEEISFNGFTYSGENNNYFSNVNIISFNLGLQYNIKNNSSFKPFVILAITNNLFSGKTSPPITGIEEATLLPTSFRIGLQGGIGLNLQTSQSFGLNLGVNLNFANIFLRSYINEYPYNSSYFTEDNIYESGSSSNIKTISYFQFYTGISFYPGRKLNK